ncbi:hypothetical protein VP01_4228g1 [Puccinia sorghi]|uniref:Uncharacterized protein n=1 Tax=Puccinia sorghi TaxID=27349 RepID=A0A0L6URE2_9BASI|nr:hypothetical protein VP01_4228g1 [Puccinia sorghi]
MTRRLGLDRLLAPKWLRTRALNCQVHGRASEHKFSDEFFGAEDVVPDIAKCVREVIVIEVVLVVAGWTKAIFWDGRRRHRNCLTFSVFCCLFLEWLCASEVLWLGRSAMWRIVGSPWSFCVKTFEKPENVFIWSLKTICASVWCGSCLKFYLAFPVEIPKLGEEKEPEPGRKILWDTFGSHSPWSYARQHRLRFKNFYSPLHLLLLHRQCRNKQYKELLQLPPEPSNPVTPPSHPLEISSPLTLPGSDLHRSTSDSDNTATDSSSHLCPISLPTQPTFSKPSFVHKPHTIPSPFLNESSYQFSKSLTSYFHTTFTLKQDLNLNPIGKAVAAGLSSSCR